ncbi:hypothetical protein BLNAU_7402 [Blattamonas nauphoetae]|uniref:Uncharacterized protein n=1 Tax=Blattamonas nauphoetae TaxID=2049346 RepID=A0ABQ9Y1B5_9EUKA|nr:hypothetical protein BLNAU_7402 [Blattamonas nauphoetae]
MRGRFFRIQRRQKRLLRAVQHAQRDPKHSSPPETPNRHVTPVLDRNQLINNKHVHYVDVQHNPLRMRLARRHIHFHQPLKQVSREHKLSSSSRSSTTDPSRCVVSAISGTFTRGNDVMNCVIVRTVFLDAARQSSTTSPDCSAIDKPIEAIIFAPLSISGLFETIPDRTNRQSCADEETRTEDSCRPSRRESNVGLRGTNVEVWMDEWRMEERDRYNGRKQDNIELQQIKIASTSNAAVCKATTTARPAWAGRVASQSTARATDNVAERPKKENGNDVGSREGEVQVRQLFELRKIKDFSKCCFQRTLLANDEHNDTPRPSRSSRRAVRTLWRSAASAMGDKEKAVPTEQTRSEDAASGGGGEG